MSTTACCWSLFLATGRMMPRRSGHMCLRPLPQTQACNRQSWSSWACSGAAAASWRGQLTRWVPLTEHGWAATVAQESWICHQEMSSALCSRGQLGGTASDYRSHCILMLILLKRAAAILPHCTQLSMEVCLFRSWWRQRRRQLGCVTCCRAARKLWQPLLGGSTLNCAPQCGRANRQCRQLCRR